MPDTVIPVKEYIDTAANLASNNPTLLIRQIAIEGNTGKVKVGNGTAAYNDLPYLPINYDLIVRNSQTVHTTDFTAELWFMNFAATSSAAITVDPPSSPVINDRFGVSDIQANAATNNITVDFVTAGQNLLSASQNYIINSDGGAVQFIYCGASIGWVPTK